MASKSNKANTYRECTPEEVADFNAAFSAHANEAADTEKEEVLCKAGDTVMVIGDYFVSGEGVPTYMKKNGATVVRINTENKTVVVGKDIDTAVGTLFAREVAVVTRG